MKNILNTIYIIYSCMLFSACYPSENKTKEEAVSLISLGDKQISSLTNNSANIRTNTKLRSRESENTSTRLSLHYGIDISHYQGDVLERIPSGDSLQFIICKATEGNNYVDTDFHSNWKEIRAKGFVRGAYHFYVCADDPLKQAIHFASTIHGIQTNDIAPIVDIEQGGMSKNVGADQMQKDLLLFLSRLEVLIKRKPIIYTDYAFAQEYLKNPIFSEYHLWLAEYSNASSPQIPQLWKEKGILIWQKSDSYDAASTHLDFDVSFGLLQNLTE